MPRYYFDFDDGQRGRDAEGTELPSIKEAEREARETLAQVFNDRVRRDSSSDQTVKLSVRDEADAVVYLCVASLSSGAPRSSSRSGE